MTSTPENPRKHWLSPSSAHRWSQCFYSAYYEKDAPYTSSAAAERGTLIHYHAGLAVASALRDIYPDAAVVIKDAVAPDGAVDADGTLLVGEYIDRVADIIGILERQGWSYTGAEVETELAKMPVRGSADLVLRFKNGVGQTAACVVDLKTGSHQVAADDNPQLLAYALIDGKVDYHFGAIIQPDGMDYRPVLLDKRGETAKAIIDAIRYYVATEAPKADVCKMGDWCKFCRTSGTCPRQAAVACHTMNECRHRKGIPEDLQGLSDLYRVLKAVVGNFDAVKAAVKGYCALGATVPGLYVQHSARRSIPSDIETLTALAGDLGVPLSDIATMVPKPESVAVLERRYGADKLHPYVKSTPIETLKESK